jgi:hypothetical protein
MAVTFVQSLGTAASTGNGTTVTFTLGGGQSIAAGNFIVVRCLNSTGGTITSITCTQTNLYTLDLSLVGPSNTNLVGIATARAMAGLTAGDTITVTFSDTDKVRLISVAEYAGVLDVNAITFVSKVAANHNFMTSPGVVNYTVTAGNDRILLIKVSVNAANTGGTGTFGVTSVSSDVDGAFTLAKAQGVTTEAAPYNRAEIWYLINPTVGAHAISVAHPTDGSPAGTKYAVLVAEQWNGVHQTTPFINTAGAQANSGTITVNVTSAIGAVVTDVVSARGRSSNHTVGAGQTLINNSENNATTTGQNNVNLGSHEPGAGTVTMSWTNTGNLEWAQAALSLRAFNSALDKTVSASGSDQTPDSGLTAATTFGDELVAGAIGYKSESPVLTEGADLVLTSTVSGTSGAVGRKLNSLHRIVTATGQYKVNGTLNTSGDWAALCATYKGLVVSTSFVSWIYDGIG